MGRRRRYRRHCREHPVRRTELSTHRGAFQCDGLPLTTHIPSAIILALLRPACLPPPPPPPPAPPRVNRGSYCWIYGGGAAAVGARIPHFWLAAEALCSRRHISLHKGGWVPRCLPCCAPRCSCWPHSICRCFWQVGNRLRIDGTLMGVDDSKQRSFIPRWKRGHFSLLVNAGGPTACLGKWRAREEGKGKRRVVCEGFP